MNLGSENKEGDGDNAHFSESMLILGEEAEDSQLVFEKILVLISQSNLEDTDEAEDEDKCLWNKQDRQKRPRKGQ